MSDRERFEKWTKDAEVPYNFAQASDGSYCSVVAHWIWMAWQAAIQAERERCAKIAESEFVTRHDAEEGRAGEVIADAIRRGEGV